jgi:hypothetical protein
MPNQWTPKRDTSIRCCPKCGETDPAKFPPKLTSLPCRACVAKRDIITQRLRHAAVKDARIAATDGSAKWNLILRKHKLYEDAGRPEWLIYEANLTRSYIHPFGGHISDYSLGGSPGTALEMEVYAGLWGDGWWRDEIRAKVNYRY